MFSPSGRGLWVSPSGEVPLPPCGRSFSPSGELFSPSGSCGSMGVAIRRSYSSALRAQLFAIRRVTFCERFVFFLRGLGVSPSGEVILPPCGRSFSPSGESLFFCSGKKKVTKKKAALRGFLHSTHPPKLLTSREQPFTGGPTIEPSPCNPAPTI